MLRLSRKTVLALMLTTAVVCVPVAARYDVFGPAPASASETTAPVLPGSFRALVARNRPAVVTVSVRAPAGELPDMPGLDPFGPQGPFRDFFERFGQRAPEWRRRAPEGFVQGVGSGFIIDAAGLIVTNNHVVENASEIVVTLDDGTELDATLVGRDDKTDLAVLRVRSGDPLPTVAWGDSDAVQAGDWVVAIGNPFGLGGTVTAGIVSARGRDLRAGPYDDFIQVDAAINRGNSGGPLFDVAGNVIGVNTAIFSPNGGNIGLGFAIPSNLAKSIVARLARGEKIERGFLGVSIQSVTPEIAAGLGIDSDDGAIISAVTPGSAADRAGLRPGDVITRIGSTRVTAAKDLSRAVADLKPGETARIGLIRNGEPMELEVKVGRLADRRADAGDATGSATASEPLGLALADPTPAEREQLGLAEETVSEVVPVRRTDWRLC
jgi:serine protease Do